jgi:hypothetical protein
MTTKELIEFVRVEIKNERLNLLDNHPEREIVYHDRKLRSFLAILEILLEIDDE